MSSTLHRFYLRHTPDLRSGFVPQFFQAQDLMLLRERMRQRRRKRARDDRRVSAIFEQAI